MSGWMVPEHKLDPQQRGFINSVSTNMSNTWIKGFAGSGKSILLVYTIKKIRSSSPNARMLLVVFTKSLEELFKAAFRELGFNVEVCTYYKFMSSSTQYDYILCDEVQDLTPRVLSQMKARSRHVIVAGDSNQSIYESDPKWNEATVSPSEITKLINGRDFELNIIHRLSRSIISAINKFLPNMSIFRAKEDMTKTDVQIRLCEGHSKEEEVSYIMENALKAVNNGYSVAVLIPHQANILNFVSLALSHLRKPAWTTKLNQWGRVDFGTLNTHLSRNGIKMQYVGSGYGSFSDANSKINIMTFHSAKGLDFDQVFIPFANSSMFIHSNNTLAKTLFMVAMTRARQDLYITYYGYKSDYLEAFANDCSHISISNNNNAHSGVRVSNQWGI